MTSSQSREAVVDLLNKSDLFSGLAKVEATACAAKFRETRFAKGQLIFARGDAGDTLYLIAEGRVRLAVATEEGRELSFQVAGEGDLFGEIAVLDGGPRSAEAVALAPTRLYGLRRDDFRRLQASSPAIAEAVVICLCARLRDLSERLETIALHPLHVRLARFLLAALAGRELTAGRRVPLELGISQGELALLLGATRSKTNGALETLESAGAIKRTADRLFCDPPGLERIARRFEAGEA